MPSNMQLLLLEPECRLHFNKTPMTSSTATLKLSNLSSGNVAFKIKTTAPKAYHYKPGSGTLTPNEVQEVQIILQPHGHDENTIAHRFRVQAVPVQSCEDVSREQWGEFPKETIQEQRLHVVLEDPTVVDLKVKYDELVQYTSMLEKDKKKLEEQQAQTATITPPMRDTTAVDDLKVKNGELVHYTSMLEKDKKKLEVELAKRTSASDSGSCDKLQMVVVAALGFLLAYLPKLIFERGAHARSTNS